MLEEMKQKDWYILLAGFLGALKLFLEAWFHISLSADQLNSLINLASFVVLLIVIPTNTYITQRLREKRALKLEQKRLEAALQQPDDVKKGD